MGTNQGSAAWPRRHSWRDSKGQPAFRGSRPLPVSSWNTVAGPSGAFRELSALFIHAFAVGLRAEFGREFFSIWQTKRTMNTLSLTAPSFAHTSIVPALKKNGEHQEIGRSRGGLSTKINATVDALGNPTGFVLTPGQAPDLDGSDELLPTITADTVLADKGYDADERVIEPLRAAGKEAVVPSKRHRKEPRPYDKELYKARHLIENFFCKLKQFRAIATRYDKTARNFLAAIYLVASLIWLI